ncbi:S8 family serine peptidase [Peribacillus psychrosaccharolyticus]|uniref:S8 family serine peptidase n=1 Tax=Peribacillus psychrosaccharolyticus TaxID=1407 RepID=A0A974NK15_PERPY|nr:S8 family serine peptidase [Peribacillus psychrosaccharolyticus]MEC2055430.1 S8 family serine peptidase [Peribacillus psychrosaccharolyticus]MED3743540.1 S8 family serine peptidase [Peribacillus psychrosaccharolyticus]QQS99113.1 S8 family serine peptidase [Peribacillus psychrosaccharolyticus]
MKKIRRFRKRASIGLVGLLTVSNLGIGANFVQAETDNLDKLVQLQKSDKKVSDFTKDFKDGDRVRVIVELEGEPAINYSTKKGLRYKDLKESEKTNLQADLKGEHADLLAEIKDEKIGFEVENTFTTVVNGVSGEVEFSQIEELEKLPNVEGVSIVNEYERPSEKPEMLSSKSMVEAVQTWNAGYNGAGMVVGIIDTGIDPDHKDMVLSKDTKYKLSAEKIAEFASTKKIPGKYFTSKVPYGYNYADKNNEILDLGPDASMHGMHVAGTVGANGDENGNGIKGVAPEAQLLALKVFGNDQAMPSTFGDIYIKAIDDGIILGADVLNMSLGSTAGFVDTSSLEQKAIDRAVDNGVLMSISAGNSAQIGNGYSNPLATNPDIGLVGSPGLSTNSMSVASIENDKVTLDKMMIKIGNETLPIAYKTQSSPIPLTIFGKNKELDVVYVGDGSPAQYTGKDVKGKVVFAVRNAAAPNYGEIQAQAEKAGAAGVIVRGTAAHGDYVSMALNNPTIPLVSLSIADGTTLETKIKAASGVGKVSFTGDMTTVVNGAAGQMSSFSSWGVTPSLEIKPEITAPGGQIYSTLNDNKYGVMSGTSMAAPHASGGSALVLQKVQELFPNLTGADKVKRAKTMLMNTAKIVTDKSNSNIAYSPRLQGSGLMQLNAAVSTPVYVEAKGTKEGKIELKEIGNDVFSMTVTATNFSKEDATYNVGASVLTDAITGSGPTARNALKEQVINGAKIKIDTPKVTLFAGETKDITVKVDLSSATKALEAAQKNGYFVEGFITLTNESQDIVFPDLSVPYVGFKGDWNKAPIVDEMIYNLGSSYYKVSGMVDQEGEYLGFNPFTGAYLENKIAISPNKDGFNESVTPVVSFLRNSKSVEYAITDKNGKVLRKLRTDKDQRKNYYASSPYSYKGITEWDGNLNNKVAADGTYFYQFKTQVDYAGKEPQIKRVPVIVDNTAPVVENTTYSSKNGVLSFDASDNANGSGLQYIEIIGDGKSLGYIDPGTKKSFKFAVDKKVNPENIVVTAYDYAFNHSGQTVSGPGDNTIPYIVSDTPEALGAYDTRQVPVSGYVADSSGLEYLRVKGDKLTKTPQDLPLTYNKLTKNYDFSSQITFKEDGVHDIYFEGADKVGNKIEFRRQVIIDTTAPTLEITGLPADHVVTEDPTVTVNIADNFDDLRLQVNGSEEYQNGFDEPYEMRPTSKEVKVDLILEDGENKVEFKVTDLVGHVTKETLIIYKGASAPAAFVTSLTLENGDANVTVDQPAKLKAEASQSVVWDAKVIAPNGDETVLEAQEGKTFNGTFKPDNLAESGAYKFVVGIASASKEAEVTVPEAEDQEKTVETDVNTEEGTEAPGNTEEAVEETVSPVSAVKYEVAFNVSNYPVTVEKVTTLDKAGNVATAFKADSIANVKTVVKNLGSKVINPTVIFQVKDTDGAVVYFEEVSAKAITSGSNNRFGVNIPLADFDNGKYTVEVFIWDNQDNLIPLADSSTIATFTVN